MRIILVDAWNTLFTEDGIFNEMVTLLDRFPNKKIVVTNANKEEVVEFGIDKSPYEVFTLEHNPDKTDPIFFITLMKKKNLTPESLIYFEHNKNAVASAESVGIKSFWYDKDKKDLGSLNQFLRKNA